MTQPTLPTDFAELRETFALLDEWEDRYRYLIDLGRALPPLSETERSPANIVEGCTSQVWLVPGREPGSDGATRLVFRADSDAHIVRGLLAVLLVVFSGRTPAEIQAVDIDADFTALGLAEHLSPNRRNGFFAVVGRIRGFALALAG